MPDSLKETLRSDGTAFTVVGDSNIVSGDLLDANGQPIYPIVISLASEAVTDDEAAQLTNYVAAGGFLFVGSSAFTRYPDGTTRSNFALADEMGLNMVNPSLTNWVYDTVFTKVMDNRLVSQIPSGTLGWEIPMSANEVAVPPVDLLFGPLLGELPYLAWQVRPSSATVIANADDSPYLTVKHTAKAISFMLLPCNP